MADDQMGLFQVAKFVVTSRLLLMIDGVRG